MTPSSDAHGGESPPTDPMAAAPSPPRIPRFWLVLALVVVTAAGDLSGDAPIGDSWLLPAAAGALTLFSLVFAKTLDLAVKESRP